MYAFSCQLVCSDRRRGVGDGGRRIEGKGDIYVHVYPLAGWCSMVDCPVYGICHCVCNMTDSIGGGMCKSSGLAIPLWEHLCLSGTS